TKLFCQLGDRVRFGFGDLANAILITHHIDGPGIENLHRRALRLLHDLAPVFRIGVVAIVGALVDKALAGEIDDDADRIGVLLAIVEQHSIAARRVAYVPGDGRGGRPAAGWLGTNVECRTDAIAGV